MKTDWRVFTVQELVNEGLLDEPLDGNHGELHPKTSDYVSSGVPFIMANDILNGRVNYSSCSFISEQQSKTLRKGFARFNDVLLTHKATIGRTALVGDEYSYIVLTPQVTYYRAKNGIIPRYLKYYFDSPDFQRLFAAWAGGGSTRAYLGILAQRKLPIVIPPLETQKKIAAVLGALDDKIELNRKMNENLESQAQALFKSWFIDFTPFGGKMPKDWKKGVLADIAEINPARLLKKGEAATCIEMADLSTSTAFPNDWGMKTFNGGMKFKNGDTIMARITPCLENGKAAFVNCLAEGEVAFGSTEYITICSKGMAPNEMFYSLVRDADFISYATKHMNGSSGRQRVAGVDIAAYPFVIADDGTYAKISPILKCVFEKIRVNSLESRKLAELRDALLPKLMKGEVEAL